MTDDELMALLPRNQPQPPFWHPDDPKFGNHPPVDMTEEDWKRLEKSRVERYEREMAQLRKGLE